MSANSLTNIFELKDPTLLLLHEDVGESYEAVARSAAAAVGAESGHLSLFDAETQELATRVPRKTAAGAGVDRHQLIDRSAASAQVIRTGRPSLSNAPADDILYGPLVAGAGVRSVLTVCIRWAGRSLGLLTALDKPGGFDAKDVRTLTALAGAAAVTLQNIRLYTEERDRRVLNESLREVSRALVGTLSEDAALGTVLDQMWRVVRYPAAAAVVKDGDRVRVSAARGGVAGATLPLAAAGDLREILESRQLGVLKDAGTRLPPLGLAGFGDKALAAPMVAKGEVLGALVVALDAARVPGLRDGQLVTAFADHAALFLEAGAIFRRERLARARAAAVARITRLAAVRQPADALLAAVAPEVLVVSGADRVVFYLKHDRNDVLIPAADAGVARSEAARVRELRLDVATGPLAPLRARKSVVFQDDSAPLAGSITPFPAAGSVVLVPLLSHDALLGAMALAALGRPQAFDPALVEFLHDLAQQVALGVENARLFATLSQMASTDELTGLANRRRFTEAIRLEAARARRTGGGLALLLGDVDHLKAINDRHGHPVGDEAIRHVAAAFGRGRRETDLAARLGGEEFALLLPGTDRAGAVRAAERIRRELASTALEPAGIVTISIGIACCPADGAREPELVRAADARLYAAKAAGRNRVCAADAPPGAVSVSTG
jgi:diguanylate cyclase (GGDEF)-like protein